MNKTTIVTKGNRGAAVMKAMLKVLRTKVALKIWLIENPTVKRYNAERHIIVVKRMTPDPKIVGQIRQKMMLMIEAAVRIVKYTVDKMYSTGPTHFMARKASTGMTP